MGIFFVFMLPLVAGFGLIFLIARFSPNVPRVESRLLFRHSLPGVDQAKSRLPLALPEILPRLK